MGAFEIIVGAVLLIIAVSLTGIILMQEGKGGMGALTGESGGENFGRNAGKTLNTTLKGFTKIAITVLMVLVVALNLIVAYL